MASPGRNIPELGFFKVWYLQWTLHQRHGGGQSAHLFFIECRNQVMHALCWFGKNSETWDPLFLHFFFSLFFSSPTKNLHASLLPQPPTSFFSQPLQLFLHLQFPSRSLTTPIPLHAVARVYCTAASSNLIKLVRTPTNPYLKMIGRKGIWIQVQIKWWNGKFQLLSLSKIYTPNII